MKASEGNQNDLAGFQPDPLEDLTVQDALIISALYAVQVDPEKGENIKALATKHPLFAEKTEDISARVNKFTNCMQAGQTLKAVEAAAYKLKPAHRKEAFEFATSAALADQGLTENKKKTLQMLATKLALEDEFVGRKLMKI